MNDLNKALKPKENFKKKVLKLTAWFALISILWIAGCTKNPPLPSRPLPLPNPCPEYADLLQPVYERHASPQEINLEEMLRRELCLQGWVLKFIP